MAGSLVWAVDKGGGFSLRSRAKFSLVGGGRYFGLLKTICIVGSRPCLLQPGNVGFLSAGG